MRRVESDCKPWGADFGRERTQSGKTATGVKKVKPGIFTTDYTDYTDINAETQRIAENRRAETGNRKVAGRLVTGRLRQKGRGRMDNRPGRTRGLTGRKMKAEK
jgi:hypothetical protein